MTYPCCIKRRPERLPRSSPWISRGLGAWWKCTCFHDAFIESKEEQAHFFAGYLEGHLFLRRVQKKQNKSGTFFSQGNRMEQASLGEGERLDPNREAIKTGLTETAPWAHSSRMKQAAQSNRVGLIRIQTCLVYCSIVWVT